MDCSGIGYVLGNVMSGASPFLASASIAAVDVVQEHTSSRRDNYCLVNSVTAVWIFRCSAVKVFSFFSLHAQNLSVSLQQQLQQQQQTR